MTETRRERSPIQRYVTCPDCKTTLLVTPEAPRVCCGRQYSIEIEAFLVTSTAVETHDD